MRGKRAKQLRRFGRAASDVYPVRGLEVGKTHLKLVPRWLDFVGARDLSERFNDLMLHELHPGTADYKLRERIAYVLEQYRCAVDLQYLVGKDSDAKVPENHPPIKVFVEEDHITAINGPKTQRAVYRRIKRETLEFERAA